MLTHYEVIISLLVGIGTCCVGILAVLRWAFKRGMDFQKVANSIDTLTSAADKLATSFDAFTTKTTQQFFDFERRITRLEDRQDRYSRADDVSRETTQQTHS
jgi:cell shape-determining protein MreC